jgi:hypothetical protein
MISLPTLNHSATKTSKWSSEGVDTPKHVGGLVLLDVLPNRGPFVTPCLKTHKRKNITSITIIIFRESI